MSRALLSASQAIIAKHSSPQDHTSTVFLQSFNAYEAQQVFLRDRVLCSSPPTPLAESLQPPDCDEAGAAAITQRAGMHCLARACPACFGHFVTAHENANAVPHLAIDGNFSQKRRKNTDKDEKAYCDWAIWVPDAYVDKVKVLVDEKRDGHARRRGRGVAAVSDEQGCSSKFTASLETSKDGSSAFDIKGLIALTCRHDAPILLANITSKGEGHHYALALLLYFFYLWGSQIGTVRVSYDVGCSLARGTKLHHYHPFFEQKVKWSIGCWHAYGHAYGCQLAYSTRRQAGYGLTDGESVERLWSSIRNVILTTRGMTKRHRETTLAIRSACVQERIAVLGPSALQSRLRHCLTLFAETRDELAVLLDSFRLDDHLPDWMTARAAIPEDLLSLVEADGHSLQPHVELDPADVRDLRALSAWRRRVHPPFAHLRKKMPSSDVVSGPSKQEAAQAERRLTVSTAVVDLQRHVHEYLAVRARLKVNGRATHAGTAQARAIAAQSLKASNKAKEAHKHLVSAVQAFNAATHNSYRDSRLSRAMAYFDAFDDLRADLLKADKERWKSQRLKRLEALDALLQVSMEEGDATYPWLNSGFGPILRQAIDSAEVLDRCAEEIVILLTETASAILWLQDESQRLRDVPAPTTAEESALHSLRQPELAALSTRLDSWLALVPIFKKTLMTRSIGKRALEQVQVEWFDGASTLRDLLGEATDRPAAFAPPASPAAATDAQSLADSLEAGFNPQRTLLVPVDDEGEEEEEFVVLSGEEDEESEELPEDDGEQEREYEHERDLADDEAEDDWEGGGYEAALEAELASFGL